METFGCVKGSDGKACFEQSKEMAMLENLSWQLIITTAVYVNEGATNYRSTLIMFILHQILQGYCYSGPFS
jgi:hypothetical protein